jgi:hypothetical protein
MTLGAIFCVGQSTPGSKWSPVSLFDLEARFFVPTRGLLLAWCRDAVKAGRCAAGAACAGASRPRLDGGEHEARLGRVGATISWPAAS